MNTVQLVGRIATEIRLQEFHKGSGGTLYKASFLLAVSPPVKGGQPDFVQVETWGVTAQNLVRFNGKGSRISVKGRVRGQFWNKDGGTRGGKLRQVVVAQQIEFLGAPKGQAGAAAGGDAAATEPAKGSRR